MQCDDDGVWNHDRNDLTLRGPIASDDGLCGEGLTVRHIPNHPETRKGKQRVNPWCPLFDGEGTKRSAAVFVGGRVECDDECVFQGNTCSGSFL